MSNGWRIQPGSGRLMKDGVVLAASPAELDALASSGLSAAELAVLDGVTAGTVTASKALVVGTNKNLDTLAIADGGLKLGSGAGTAVTATAAEINQKADTSNQAVTTTADGTTTGAILPASNQVLITSAAATDQAALPGIAANSLPVGHTIRGRVTANGCELITLATTNETINGVDSDGSNQLDLPAQAAFLAWVESATGWAVLLTATATPDND
jgi:hypothetical protein